ncbi:MAG: hypothetical protein ACAF41_07220 [Leptolyngbya sp. BL-A-14]
MNRFAIATIGMLPIVTLSALPKPASAATVPQQSLSRASVVILADRDDNDWRNDRRDNDWRNDRRDNDWRRDRRDNDWRNDRRDNDWRRDRRDYQRRVWIPGHWERGFLGIGRKWVAGHYESR